MTATDDTEEWEMLASAGRIDDAIVAYVAEREARNGDGACWNDVVADFSAYLPTRGDRCLDIRPNVSLHFGMSPELTDTILRLIKGQRLVPMLVSWFELMVMGGSFYNAPIATARGIEQGGYKSGDHWLPTILVLPTHPDLPRNKVEKPARKQRRGSKGGRRARS